MQLSVNEIQSDKKALRTSMKSESNLGDLDTALDYLNKLVLAEMDYVDATNAVLSHFTQVDHDELQEAYDTL